MESTSTRRHTKIQLDSNGALRLTTERFTVAVPKTTTPWQDVGNHCQHLSYPEIPKCDDRLPPEVDLGVLDMEPRQSTELVSLRCVGVSQSVDLGQNNNPNTTPTKDYENVRVVVYLCGVQRGCAEEGERGSTPTG